MNEREKDYSDNRGSVRIPDSFTINYNIITRSVFEEKASLYITRSTANRSTIRKKEGEPFSFDWSQIEDEENFDPLLVKILFYLDRKIDKILYNQEKLLNIYDTPKNAKEVSTVGKCIDISGSGVRMLITERINEGALIELTIEPPANLPLHIIVLGKLTRICPSKDKGENGFEASVTFTAINEDDREDLIKYLFQRQRELISAKKRGGNLS